MRKAIAYILTFVLLISICVPVFADDISGTLSAVGVLPVSVGEDGDLVTKDEIAYMTARLVNASCQAQDTRFADVKKDNIYSGYIEYLASSGVINGAGDGNFNPENNATFGMAAKMIVSILGFGAFAESQGGYPSGYTEVLSRLGISKNVILAPDSFMTVLQAKTLFHNVLTMEINGVTFMEMKGEVGSFISSEKSESILSKTFGISVYDGTVTSVSDDSQFITFTVAKNRYKANPVVLSAGETVNFEVSKSIVADEFNHVPVTVWVSEDETVVKIEPQKNVEVRYVNIYSVNGDTAENKLYPVSRISELTFLDDEEEYELDEDVKVFFNGKETTGYLALAGKFAKVIMINDEIIFLETWELEKGGIITEFNGANISYIKDGAKKVLRDITNNEKVITIIGKRTASLSEIKNDSVFSFYKGDNYMVIVASERKIIDVFKSVSAKEITIGEMSYLKGNVKYTENGELFTDDYTQLLNRNVAAYIGPDSKIWYVQELDDSEGMTEFYGLISGVLVDEMDPDIAKIRMYKLADNKVSEEVLTVKEKALLDGITFESLEDDLSGDGIYLFKVASSGKVVSVQNAQPLYGFKTAKGDTGAFSRDTAYVAVENKNIYFSGLPILCIDTQKDSSGNKSIEDVAFVNWSLLQAKSIAGGKIRFIGKGKSSIPTLIALSGELSGLKGDDRYGVVTNIIDSISSEGELVKQVTIISMLGTKTYNMLPEKAAKLKENVWVKFNEAAGFGESEIIITAESIVDLNGNYSDWNYGKGADTDGGLHMGVAETADKNRMVLKSVISDSVEVTDSAYFFHPSHNFFITYNPNAPQAKFKAAAYTDIDDGDMVMWNDVGGDVKGVIIIKE